MLRGLWKVERVEILENSELRKTIYSDAQYWSINGRIEIFDTSKLQNTLHIKLHPKSISSFDPGTGFIRDEFMIEKLNPRHLELCSRKKIDQAEYSIFYYLNKVDDSTAIEIKDTF